jgi:8-oxo-dGTP diphosphatase
MEKNVAPKRYTVHARTLIFLFNAGDVLLIHRSAEATLFPGRYNGVGGHIERGEDVFSAAQREVREETGLEVTDLALHGLLHVDEGMQQPGVIVFVFAGHAPQRDVIECSEGTLHWIPLEQIGQVDLLPDLPPLLDRVVGALRSRSIFPFFARSTISSDSKEWEIHFSK